MPSELSRHSGKIAKKLGPASAKVSEFFTLRISTESVDHAMCLIQCKLSFLEQILLASSVCVLNIESSCVNRQQLTD